MVSFNGLSAIRVMGSILRVAMSLTAVPAHAGDNVSEGQMLKALQPIPPTLHERAIEPLPLDKPIIDAEITFDYNSTDVRATSMPILQALGKALSSNPDLKGSRFMIAGHTDAIGGEAFNRHLSERRANSIKNYLVEKFGIAGNDLVAVGYGKSKLKRPDVPTDPVNRRVQVFSMATKTDSK